MGNFSTKMKHYPVVTDQLLKNEKFQRASLKFHDKFHDSLNKIHDSLHEAAFPEEKTNKKPPKPIEDFTQNEKNKRK